MLKNRTLPEAADLAVQTRQFEQTRRCETGRVRVVLVAPGYPASLDDHHKPFLLDHARALAAAGAQVTVVCPAHPDAPRRDQVGGIEVRRVRFAPRRVEARVALGESYRVFAGLSALWVIPMVAMLTVAAVRQARRRPGRAGLPVEPEGSDDAATDAGAAGSTTVIHGHWWFPCGLVAVAAAAVAGPRAAGVVHIHGSDAAVTTNAVHHWLARRVLRRSGAVGAVSEDLRDWAAALVSGHGGVQPPPSTDLADRRARPLLAVVPMPVAKDRFAPSTPVPDEGPVVAVGRLMAEKGFDVLIEAVALLPADERPEVVIVGDGPDRALLEALALRRDVSATFPGAVPPSEIGEWYRRARLVCVPSRREGFGMVVPEALAAGRPVVASAVGAAPAFITDGTNGHLVPPDDAVALSDALATALRSDFALSSAANTTALAPFTPQAHAAALLEIYASLTVSVSSDLGR